MNQTAVELFTEYRNELTELIAVAESSPDQFKGGLNAEGFKREFDKLLALANFYGRLLDSQNPPEIQNRGTFYEN